MYARGVRILVLKTPLAEAAVRGNRIYSVRLAAAWARPRARLDGRIVMVEVLL